MLKRYQMPNGRTYQFDEKEVPKNAVPVQDKKKAEPQNKAVTPKNKAVKK